MGIIRCFPGEAASFRIDDDQFSILPLGHEITGQHILSHVWAPRRIEFYSVAEKGLIPGISVLMAAWTIFSESMDPARLITSHKAMVPI